MTTKEFITLLREDVSHYGEIIAPDNKWIIKGFIDKDKNIYTTSQDTKVISKLMEIILIPPLQKFAKNNGLTLELAAKQNHYPDFTFKDDEGHLFAVDLKTTYYTSRDKNLNKPMTLGSFWGYFRHRDLTSFIMHPYKDYSSHTVICILYKKNMTLDEQRSTNKLDDMDNIKSTIKDLIICVQPKWKIAGDKVGSGDTRNIGSVVNIEDIINGRGTFAELGEEVFDDYWTSFLTKDDAKKLKTTRPFTNIKEYKKYKNEQKQ